MSRASAENDESEQKTRYRNRLTQTDTSKLPTASTSLTEFDKLPFTERKVALNLAQFAKGQADVALSSDQVRNLIQTLTAEAPGAVEKMIAESEKATKQNTEGSIGKEAALSEEERRDLEALIDLAQRRLQHSNAGKGKGGNLN